MEKQCKSCGVAKPEDDFTPKNKCCRACVRRKYRAKLKDVRPGKHLFDTARKRAAERGIEFSLILSDIVVPELCPYLQIPLHFTTGIVTMNTPSLDRIDNDKGYVSGNVEVISYKANMSKADMNIKQLEVFTNRLFTIVEYAKKHGLPIKD